MKKIIFIFGLFIFIVTIAFITPWNAGFKIDEPQTLAAISKKVEMGFASINLKTNTAISSIPLSEVLAGGPPKDGIPAIFEPTFVSVEEASDWLDEEALGIIYENEGIIRYYPYAILYWHEIVNDKVGNKNIAVTFCPLCGSAIIFDSKDDVFGVSGKLWESNLLMYDRKSESLWSQIRAEALVGDRTGETLEILDSNVILFSEFKKNYPGAEVLSKNTGYNRVYGLSPYGDYESNNELFFPVSKSDEAFPKKNLFHIVYVGDKSVGFLRTALFEAGKAEVEVDGQTIQATAQEDGSIKVINLSTKEQYPGFITMWFSWVTHIDKERVIWSK